MDPSAMNFNRLAVSS